MDFLVAITVRWPPDGDASLRQHYIDQEHQRARELADAGTLIRLWRLPGKWANVGIWRTSGATALHDALSSLPFYPWLEIDVTALADHPNDPAARKDI